MNVEEIRGWLSGSKGQRYLATDEGWFELVDSEGGSWHVNGDIDRRPARLLGERLGAGVFAVYKLKVIGDVSCAQRPAFVVRPPDVVRKAGNARLAVDRLLAERGFSRLMLPTLWSVSREYGQEELGVTHSQLSKNLVLLQSPEFPMYAALAMGIGAFYCWGRSFRFEADDAGRHLMEFEQIDIGLSLGDLPEMMSLVEDVVRVTAKELGVTVSGCAFPKKAPQQHTVVNTSDASVYKFHHRVPQLAIDLVVRRLRGLGAKVEVISDTPPTLVVATSDPAVEVQVSKEFDSAHRILNSAQSPIELHPWWRTPLSLRWDDENDAERSEYRIRAITSARTKGPDGSDSLAEAELYIDDLEVGHAGMFADYRTFLQNLEDAGAPLSRYDWLLPMLQDAPPGMVKVGIGWERLVTALLGGQVAEAQLFPRNGRGHLHQNFPI